MDRPISKSSRSPGGRPLSQAERLACLHAFDRKVLWLSSWIIHNANHLRPNRDGLKVGGHQASSASVSTILTALYLDVLRPYDRVAVKPHASPVFHGLQYLLGRQTLDQIQRFRAMGGAQSYPSRTKDSDDVDFSTGSVGLGVAMTSFASIVQDYVRMKNLVPAESSTGRMIAVVGDAELDEGNVYEALLEGWKHDVRNLWWIIDYNRQSLDSIISDRLFGRIDKLFDTMGWNVVTLKYGKRLLAAFARPGGQALREWIDAAPNSLYSALTYKGGAAWREHLQRDIGGIAGVGAILDGHDDAALQGLMTNLAGHDLETVLEAFHSVRDDRPTCFIAYTIKGFGLPFAGHKDNHAGLMTVEQMEGFQRAMQIPPGQEWSPFAGLDLPAELLERFLQQVPFAGRAAVQVTAPAIPTPAALAMPKADTMSTQEAFGRILNEIGREDDLFAQRIVTTSPDVTVSTNLGGWVNRRGIFDRRERTDLFREAKVVSAQRWQMSPKGQHLELGIAEHNLFLALAAMGLSHELFGVRLLPIGTLYDPFVKRGLDAFNYALYQGARFLLVGTPSGLTLAPEGGAHQSSVTPLLGLGLPGLTSFEPAFADELSIVMAWAFRHMQEADGGAVYLRLSTRPARQPERVMSPELAASVVAGGYWRVPPGPQGGLVIAYCGAIAPEAEEAHRQLLEDVPGAGLLAITSGDRLYADWIAAEKSRRAGKAAAPTQIERLLASMPATAQFVTVVDAHPATLAWLGGVRGHRIRALGVDRFGQSGDIPDLYRAYGIDSDAILDACARACLD
jgi:pyruvate dehydrogenase E1 component